MRMQLKAVRLPVDMIKGIGMVAKEMERPGSYVIKIAINRFLEEYCDYEIALKRLKDPTDKIITIEAMEKRFEK